MRLLEKTQMDNLYSMTKAHDEGKEEGRQEGLVEWEHKKALETAQNMLSKGLDVDLVSQCTGLTLEAIQSLL